MDAKRAAAWLNVAGDEKATSVIKLAPDDVKDIVEIGCGTGAVLAALDRRRFAKRYWACEPAVDLFDEIPAIDRLVDKVATTFENAFIGQTFDLAILSHVVEHMLTPADLIYQALKRARHVLVEVPIEANTAGRVRKTVKRALGGRNGEDPAGHVQFFSRRSARDLVRFAGGELVGERGYFPVAPYRAQADHGYQRAMLQVARCEPLARRYYEHFAMLVRPAQVGEWTHHYARPA